MRKIYLILLTLLFAVTTNAQLTGTKNIPGDYPTLSAAITDLNTQGVGAGGVVLNLIAGNPQSVPAGGYVIGGAGSLVLTTSSAANPVTIQGNGNTITASGTLTAGALNDAIFKLVGADWVTISGFTMLENAANTITAAATNTMTEWGVALLYVTATDGALNNTIQANTIDLDRTYQNTFGIYSNSTHTAAAVTTSATATGAAGGNSGLKIYANTITDVNNGIVVVGPTAAADHNNGLEIGGTAPNANIITNFGTTGTFSGYANVSGTVNGILVRNTINFTVSFNTITSSNGGVTAGTINGIQLPAFSNAPTGTFTNNINNNTLSIKSGLIAGAINGINSLGTSASASSTININNNDFNNCGHTVAGTAAIVLISNAGTHLNQNINNNTFTNLNVNTTGSVTFISNTNSNTVATGTKNVNNNTIVTGFTKTGAGGTVTFIIDNGSSVTGVVSSCLNNNFSNLTLTGATAITGISYTDGGTAPTRIVTGNILNNMTTGAATVNAMNFTYWNGVSSLTGNTVTNINGQGAITGITIGATVNTATSVSIASNTVTNLSSTGTGGSVTGITCSNTSPAININGNTINTLSTTGASSTVAGIAITGATGTSVFQNTINGLTGAGATSPVANGISVSSGTVVNVYKNKIYDISQSGAITTTSPSVNGMLFSGGTTVNAYNNLIGDLRAPAASLTDAIRGISITSTTAGGTYNISFNTVNISASSTGANFGTTGVFHTTSTTASTATLNLRNNAIVNNSTAAGTGQVVAFRRSSGVANALANYGNASNNNLLYAGTPGASNLIYADGTSTAQTLAQYKGGVFTAGTISPRDNSSVTENPPFISTVGANANFLHINTAIATQIESGGIPVGGITDDFDGNARNGSTPDIGADEGTFILLDVSAPAISYTNLPNTLCTSDQTLIATITDIAGVNTAPGTKPRLYFKKTTDANTYAGNTSADNGWKYVEATNASSPFSFTTNFSLLQSPVAGGDVIQYFVVAQDLSGTPNVGIFNGTFAATPASVALTVAAFPISGSINSFNVLASGLSGTITIGAAGTYTSLTGAGGLFAALNTGGLSGNVTANIIDASITESGANALNQIAYGCGGPYTLTIKPGAGVSATLTGSFASGAMIRIFSRNVTIDGSNNGTTSRDLTIANTSVTSPSVLLIGSIGTTAITNVTLKNSIVINGVNTSSAVVVTDGTTLGNPGYFNNITIQNNSIQRAYIGLFCNAAIAAGNGNIAITSNDVNTSGANAIRICALYVQGTDGATISQNNVSNLETTSAENDVAIWMATGAGNTTVSGNTITGMAYTGTGAQAPIGIRESSGLAASGNNIIGNTLTNITSSGSTAVMAIDNSGSGTIIQKNTVRTVFNSNTGTHGSYGINVSGGNNVTIQNNFISDVNHDMTGGIAFSTTFGVFGIRIAAGTGHKVYHNSVNLFGLQPGTANSSLLTAAFCLVATGSTGCDVRNNIFANNITGGTTSVGHVSAYLPSGGSAAMNLTWNNNAYYYGTDAARQGVGQAGTTAGTNFFTTLAALTAYTNTLGSATNDNASFASTAAVPYVSASDLHVANGLGANWCLNGTGAPVGVLDDIDAQVRSTGLPPAGPDMGADEFVATGDANAAPPSQTVCTGVPITTIFLSGTATSFSWTRNNTVAVTGIAASGTGNISGTLNNTTAAPVTVTFTIYPVNASGCFGPSITATVIVTPNNTIALSSGIGTDAQTVCINTPITNITYTTTGATGASFSGLPAGVSGNWAANVVTISGTPTVAGPFNYTVTLTGGCGSITANGTISVTPNNTITLSSGPGTDAQTVCINTPITNITYTTTGATGASFSGLPAGVTGNWTANVVTISGTPTAAGPFNYTVTLTGGCGNITANGSITVSPNNTITLSSAPGTNAQSVCVNSPITNITYTTTGATGASFSGLPAGVSGNWAANVVTISGTPTATGPFNYTVTLTGGCGNITANGSITVNPLPSIGDVTTQPTTCVSTDGAINITVSGTPGPYSYAWTTSGGSGLNPIAEDQTGLTVGQYTVVVTDQTTGCQQTAVFNLTGPGGCSICPTIGSVTTNPSGGSCEGTPVVITASGLSFMGVTYGISFIESPVALVDPYAGGTVIGTVPNGSLGGGGTTASITTSSLSAGNHYIYAILTPVPSDPFCRPAASATILIGQVPTVDPVANQTVCNNANTAAITFSGNLLTTNYNWTNNTPSIGLAASGSGNIASFVATNAGTAPVTATITVTPSNTTTSPGSPVSVPFGYTGSMQTWTVPAGVTSITIETNGAEGGSGALGNNGGPIVNFGGVGGRGSRATGTLAVTPGQVLNIFVGGAGGTPTAGFNGGGTGGVQNSGGGGGASDVRFPGATIADRIIVAGGGGGGGRGGCETNTAINGGNGGDGDGNGGNGTNSPDGGGGFGGVGSAFGGAGIGCAGFLGQPGAAGIAAGTGGDGGSGQGCCCFIAGAIPGGGGGGGGYFGGGGGGGGSAGTTSCSGNNKGGGGGGAGGSSYTGGVTVGTVTNGVQQGDGSVVITYLAVGASVTCTGTPTTFTITVNPTATVNAVPNQTVCNGANTAAVIFTSPTTGGTIVYNWTNNTPSIGLAASGSGNIGSFVATNAGTAPVTATITVTPTYTNGTSCVGTPITFTITVNPTATVNAVPNQTVCNGANTAAVIFTSPTTGGTIVYNWTNNTASIGLAASGSGNIGSFVATNAGTAPVTATITVTPTYTNGVSCVGTPVTFTITVNPTATVNAVANQTVCNGTGTAAVTFSSPTTGGTIVYNWTNNTPSIGLAASGAGNIGSFTATNAGVTPVTATITVTPTYTNVTSCVGTPVTFTITVNPTPTVNVVANQTLCSGASTTAINFSGAVAGTVYNWTNNTPSIGLAASGTGNIASFVATNAGAAPVTATITVTPSYTNGGTTCTGTPRTFTITVNPVPAAVATPSSQTICSGTAITAIALTSGTPGTTYTWTRNNTANVTGIAASGSGNSISGTLTNTTAAQQTVTFTIIPTANGCPGPAITATVIVQAPLSIVCPANITVPAAAGTCAATVTFAATVTGTPAPTVTYTPASGSSFPVGTTTVNVSATNSCGTVTCSFTVTVTDVQVPVITTQPANRTVCLGTNATFSVVSTFAASYQWQSWNGTTWVNIPGTNSSSFTVNNVTHAMNTNSYRVIVTGPCGATATSTHATLYVNPLPIVSISSDIAPQLLPNQFITLTANANPAGGTYVWFKNGVVIPGATASTLGPLDVLDAGTYKVTYTALTGCVSTSPDFIISALLTENLYIYPNPNSGQFHIRFYNATNQDVTVTVYNYLGAIVFQKKHTAGNQPYSIIDVDLGQRLAIGTYLVDVRNLQGLRIGAKMISVGRQ